MDSKGGAVQSLKKACVGTLIRYRAHFGDLGDVDANSILELLSNCSYDELSHIEDATREGSSKRDLSWYTWHFWHKIYIKKLGYPSDKAIKDLQPLPGSPPEDYIPPSTKAPQGNWRELLERTNAEHKDKAASLSGRLKELYEAGKQIKDSRKAKIVDAGGGKAKRRKVSSGGLASIPANSARVVVTNRHSAPAVPPPAGLQRTGSGRLIAAGARRYGDDQPKMTSDVANGINSRSISTMSGRSMADRSHGNVSPRITTVARGTLASGPLGPKVSSQNQSMVRDGDKAKRGGPPPVVAAAAGGASSAARRAASLSLSSAAAEDAREGRATAATSLKRARSPRGSAYSSPRATDAAPKKRLVVGAQSAASGTAKAAEISENPGRAAEKVIAGGNRNPREGSYSGGIGQAGKPVAAAKSASKSVPLGFLPPARLDLKHVDVKHQGHAAMKRSSPRFTSKSRPTSTPFGQD